MWGVPRGSWVIPGSDFRRRVAKPAKEKPAAPTDRDSVVRGVHHVLRSSVYEDCDFSVTDDYISVDLVYDSRDYVRFYQGQVKSMYPRNTRVRGTRVTIKFGDHPWARRR